MDVDVHAAAIGHYWSAALLAFAVGTRNSLEFV